MSRTAVVTQGVAPPQAHYSHGIVARDGSVYVSGQVAVDESGRVVEGGAEAQARQVLENLRRIVAAAGATMDDVVKTTVYLTSLDDREPVGRARRDAFGDPPPANTLLVVTSLADPRFLVEIEAIVVPPR